MTATDIQIIADQVTHLKRTRARCMHELKRHMTESEKALLAQLISVEREIEHLHALAGFHHKVRAITDPLRMRWRSQPKAKAAGPKTGSVAD